ncbi:unnamed protein product [Pedinophyceae sp. YPF-701]|nr:unnamed protein product [Pedinophyceae sp. YPF-701]
MTGVEATEQAPSVPTHPPAKQRAALGVAVDQTGEGGSPPGSGRDPDSSEAGFHPSFLYIRPEDVVRKRRGNVLTKGTLLKADHFPGCQNKNLRPLVSGAPNYRQVPGLPVYGVAIPTLAGIRNVLEIMGAGDGARTVVWFNMREEPVVYINGKPYVLREADRPFSNVEYTGIDWMRVEAMEQRLRADILAEARRYGGSIIVTHENDDSQVVSTWEPVSDVDVQTPREAYEELVREGYRVVYRRVPVTDEKAPKATDCDLLAREAWHFAMEAAVEQRDGGARRLVSSASLDAPGAPEAVRGATTSYAEGLRAPGESDDDVLSPGARDAGAAQRREQRSDEEARERSTCFMFNCQMGRGRTTTGMIIASMVLLHQKQLMAQPLPRWLDIDAVARGSAARRASLDSPQGGANTKIDDESRLKEGMYAVVRSLMRVLQNGAGSKALLDDVIDANSAMQNLREAIAGYRTRVLKSFQFEDERSRVLSVCQEYLERYCVLLTFSSYLLSRDFCPLNMTPAALRTARVPVVSFESWTGARPELSSILQRMLRRNPVAALAMHRAGDFVDASRHPPAADTSLRIAGMLAERAGAVLGPHTVLKYDHFPGVQIRGLPKVVDGAPNFRGMVGIPVFGTALPTVDGVERVLALIAAQGKREGPTLWFNMREEPVVYINGNPYVLRDEERPFKNLQEYSGITGGRIEDMEARLKEDVLKEAAAHGGKILVAYEWMPPADAGQGGAAAADAGKDAGEPTQQIEEVWQHIATPDAVKTPREVARWADQRYAVEYRRIPVTDGSAPTAGDLQDILNAVEDAPLDSPMVFQCQMGVGRTTTGMVIGTLIHLARTGRLSAIARLPSLTHLGPALGLPASAEGSPRAGEQLAPMLRAMETAYWRCKHHRIDRLQRGLAFTPGESESESDTDEEGGDTFNPGQSDHGPPRAQGRPAGTPGRSTSMIVTATRQLAAANLAASESGGVARAAPLPAPVRGRHLVHAGPSLRNDGDFGVFGSEGDESDSGMESPPQAAKKRQTPPPSQLGPGAAAEAPTKPQGDEAPVSQATSMHEGSLRSVGGDHERHDPQEEMLRAGAYAAVRRLVKLLPEGQEIKRVLDEVIDACSVCLNLRLAISKYRRPRKTWGWSWRNRAEVHPKTAAFRRGIEYLERYTELIAFSWYLHAHGQGVHRSVTFGDWLAGRPDLLTALASIRENPAAALELEAYKTSPATLQSSGQSKLPWLPRGSEETAPAKALPEVPSYGQVRSGSVFQVLEAAQRDLKDDERVSHKEEEALLRRRRGLLLTRRTILKKYAIPVKPTATIVTPSAVAPHSAAPNVIELAGLPIVAVASPTVMGLRALLDLLGAGPQPAGKLGAEVVLLDLREELVLHMNGFPYVRRDMAMPAASLHHAGLQAWKLQELENQLKNDALMECMRSGGRVLVHDEVAVTRRTGSHAAAQAAAEAGAIPASPGTDGETLSGPSGAASQRNLSEGQEAAIAGAIAAVPRGKDDVSRRFEEGSSVLLPRWVPVNVSSFATGICSPLDAAESLQEEGYALTYARVPLSRERTPQASDIDILHRLITVPPVAPPPGAAPRERKYVILSRTADGSSVRFVAAMLALHVETLRSSVRQEPPADRAWAMSPPPSPAMVSGHGPAASGPSGSGGGSGRSVPELRAISSLVRVLPRGAECKAAVDEAARRSARIGSLVHDIAECAHVVQEGRERKREATPQTPHDTSRVSVARQLGLHYLKRYFYLITFASYLREAPGVPFSSWVHSRLELKHLMSNLSLTD